MLLKRKKQQGFVLISVLLITTISTVVAVSSIGENRLQERIAGNQIKEVNARSEAERGIFSSYQFIQDSQATGATLDTILQTIAGQSEAGKYILTAENGATANSILITSEGKYHGATAYLKAEIEVTTAAGGGDYDSAVVGCEGVTLTGSGLIDSFNSLQGSYADQYLAKNGSAGVSPEKFVNAKADIATTDVKGANIDQRGNAPIYGNANATGNYDSSGSSSLLGNVKADGNVTLNSKNSATDRITGDVYAGGNFDALGNTTGGNAFVVGDAKDTNRVTGTVNFKGSLSGDSRDGGWVEDASVTAPNVPTESCDRKNLAAEAPSYSGFTSNGNYVPKNWETSNSAGVEFKFTEEKADYFNPSYAADKPENGPMMLQTDSMPVTILGEVQQAHVFDKFELNSRNITVSGDVYIVVKNDFIMSGNASKISIEKGSSLTMIVAGEVKTITDAQVVEVDLGGDSSANKAPMSLFSVKETTGNAVAVDLQGKNLNMTVEAPFGKVSVNASGSFMGAIRGKTVDVKGAGGLHYDEKLGSGITNPGGSHDVVKFASIYYHYPN